MIRTALNAYWRLDQVHDTPDVAGQMTVTSAEEVQHLVDVLSRPDADDAYATHLGRPTVAAPLLGDDLVPDHVLHLAVRGGWGYLTYAGNAVGYWDGFTGHPQGDPRSPGTHGHYNTDYPAGSGLPLPQFTDAIVQFLVTGELPTCVHWISEDDSSPQRAAS